METTTIKTAHNQSVDNRELDKSALELIDRLFKIEKTKSDILPGEITVRDYKNKIGLSRQTASIRLNKLVNDGVLFSRMVIHCGQRIKVYRDVK